jgi:hypothetical protein
MKIIYRISDAGYSKVKPKYINNRNCLWNAVNTFQDVAFEDWTVIADNVSEETDVIIQSYIPRESIEYVSVGHGAGTFNLALDKALTFDDNEIVYFIENDYLHLPNSKKIIEEGLNEIGADFVSLYDHPDKYIDGANPYVQGGGEMTRVMLSKSSHWKVTNSTTMTFASKVKTLRKVGNVLREYTQGSYPRDFDMFVHLYNSSHYLVTPIPGYSTHGETAWLTPLIDWSKI